MTTTQWEILNSALGNSVLVTAVLGAIGALASAIGGAVVLIVRRYLLHRLSADEIATVDRLAGIAVRWVEQTSKPGTADHDRLVAATDFVLGQAKARGLLVDRAFAIAAVEAAVLGLAHSGDAAEASAASANPTLWPDPLTVPGP